MPMTPGQAVYKGVAQDSELSLTGLSHAGRVGMHHQVRHLGKGNVPSITAGHESSAESHRCSAKHKGVQQSTMLC